MRLNVRKNLTSTCWNAKYETLTIGMTDVKCTGCSRLGSTSLFVPHSFLF